MKLTLTATIEGRRLNQRTMIPIRTFPVTIPYGSTLENAFYYPGPIWHGSDWIKTQGRTRQDRRCYRQGVG
jgi:hypothetical protein